jgi:hypothetical protein
MLDVPPSSPLLRLPRPPPDFQPARAAITFKAFEPSTEDRRHEPVAVSVWDETLTSDSQVIAFREAPFLVFRIPSEKRAEIQGLYPQVLVKYMPLDESKLAFAGANGHAGILGLDRPADSNQTKADAKAYLKTIRIALALCCEFVKEVERVAPP